MSRLGRGRARSNSHFGVGPGVWLRYRALFIKLLRGDRLLCLFRALLGESFRRYFFDSLTTSGIGLPKRLT
jgi:hypothetical protein